MSYKLQAHHERQTLPAPKTRKGEATKRRIIQAAEEIFGAKGYYATSIVEITQQANIAQGTFYLYFSSKEDLFRELVVELSRDFRHFIQSTIADAPTAIDAQLLGFRAFFTWVKEHRNLYRIVQQAVLVDEKLFRWYYERLAQGYQKGLEAGSKGGEFRIFDPETVAYLLMGMGQFLGMRWVYWEEGDAEVPASVLAELDRFVTLALQGGAEIQRR